MYTNRNKPISAISIVDIAKQLKISVATVSRALNNHPQTSEATKKRVKEKALEMGYRHNKMASSLRNNKSNIVGLIVPRVSMYFQASFITALQNRLQEAGYNTIICQSNDSVALEKILANTLFSSRVDALVVSLSLYTEEYSHFDEFMKNGVPLIFYDRVPIKPYPAYIVKGDDYNGGFLAGSHLVETGCKDIAYISGPLTTSLYIDRTAGFVCALEEHGLSLRKEWVFHIELTRDNAWKAVKELFSGETVPDGIFAANDTAAVAVVEFARESGIRIPEDLKVIGYSNDPRTSIILPKITSIEQHPAEMAATVAYQLLSLLESKIVVSQEEATIIPVTLIKRMST